MIYVKNPELLKKDLTTNGNSMTSIASKLDCSKAYISSIVAGTRNPNPKVAVGICELLKNQFDKYFFIDVVNK